MKIHIDIVRLEPGRHISRNVISRQRLAEIDIPENECKEVRPDWGQYFPVVTFPAIERALRARGYLFGILCPDEQYSFGILS